MKIAKIETSEIMIPLVTPFKTALRTVENVHDIVVRITADTGEEGFGEAPPTAVITGDTLGSIRCAIDDFIAPSLVGMDIDDIDGIMKKLHGCILKNTSAKAAVDMAVYDLFAKSCKKPLYKVLGGSRKELENAGAEGVYIDDALGTSTHTYWFPVLSWIVSPFSNVVPDTCLNPFGRYVPPVVVALDTV